MLVCVCMGNIFLSFNINNMCRGFASMGLGETRVGGWRCCKVELSYVHVLCVYEYRGSVRTHTHSYINVNIYSLFIYNTSKDGVCVVFSSLKVWRSGNCMIMSLCLCVFLCLLYKGSILLWVCERFFCIIPIRYLFLTWLILSVCVIVSFGKLLNYNVFVVVFAIGWIMFLMCFHALRDCVYIYMYIYLMY